MNSSRLFLFLLAISFLISASAVPEEEQRSRRVIGGDLLYSASSLAATEQDALFRAESQAVRMIAIECLVAPKGIKIFNQSVTPTPGKFRAAVTAGISIAECDQARRASEQGKARAAHPVLSATQAAYEQSLERADELARPRPQIIQRTVYIRAPAVEKPAFSFPRREPTESNARLEAQINCREQVRNLLRRGDSRRADQLMVNCR